jgi:DNA adenine methylase
MTAPTRPVLRWHGGKWLLAPWIIAQMPDHVAYVEAFGGGASVLLRKRRTRLEIYNDLDGEVVNLFRVLRTDPQALAERIALTPFAREEFEAAYRPCGDGVERAVATLIKSHMGFGSNAVHRVSGFRAAGLRAGVLPVHNWADLPMVVRAVAERLRGVVIEHRDALSVMAANDGADVLHYVDPPYPMGTRSDAARDYAHEMTDAQHSDLLAFLRGLKGRVILSGYPCEMYDSALPDWRRVERAALADGAKKRTEVLWMNWRGEGLL